MSLLSQLVERLTGRPRVRPVVLRARTSSDGPHAGASLTPWTDPSSGLIFVGGRWISRQHVQAQSDLDKTVAVERAGFHEVHQSISRSAGDTSWAAVENNGRRTLIAARRSAPTLPTSVVPSRVPFGGDVRTAPSGLLGQAAGGMEPFGRQAERTRQRTVPPTDAGSLGEQTPGGWA